MKKLRRGAFAALLAAAFAVTALPAEATAQPNLQQLSSQGPSQAVAIVKSLGQSGLGFRAVNVDGMIRPYTLVLPRNYNPMRAYPVIIGFGGWKHDAGATRSYQQLERAAGDRAIVVYPQGMGDAWGGSPYARTSMGSDIRFVRAVVDNVGSMHKIDRKRIYAAGLSNGGGMAAALACHAPDLVAGVASVAGAYYNPTVTNCAAGTVPTLIMHADNDDVVRFDGGVRHGAPYRSVPSVFADFGRRNRCDMNTVAVYQAGNETVSAPAGCAARTELRKVGGGGHTWFPGATDQAVRFFLG